MWQKFKEQIPAVLLIAVVVVGVGVALYKHQQTVQEVQDAQQREITKQRQDFESKLQSATDANRRQIESVNKLMTEAIEKRSADMFMTQEEVNKLNAEKVDALAEAIAKKVQPYNPLPKTPEEAEKQQNEQIDKVSTRLADKINPIVSEMGKEMAKGQNLTQASIDKYSQRISDQVSRVLTSEMARNQVLNNNLQETQAVADDSLKLSHELTALYLSSFKDQGLITRLLTLPANVVKDVTSLSVVNSNERKKIEEDLMAKMADIEKRLEIIRVTQAPK